MLQGKKILLGITGSIAAYKSAILCRLLIKEGCEVKVVMTHAAKSFISPLTLSTLSGHSVGTDINDGETWNNHVELGIWADLILIAPCTATTISKTAHGLADNFLTACYLSAKCPAVFAPAMDLDMWKHPSTIGNLKKLQEYGNHIIPVGNGFLASGLHGDGRMADPEEIVQYIAKYFRIHHDLANKKILITAGPTFEALDPVRFIGNRSSGKMGYAIAEQCAQRGAEVTIISGPVQLSIRTPGIDIVHVESANQMHLASSARFDDADIIILAAAVADYTPVVVANQKIKKTEQQFSIELKRTVDIAADFGKRKIKDKLLVGFALETNNEIENATKKLHTKNLDIIVLNKLNDAGAGFQHDTNRITILDRKGNNNTYPLKSKSEVATDIVDYIVNYLNLDQ
ncbi:MAG: bifunctional phosphopantothenoylcysteine decarboxylase/phosphopantothenate--cysteine ligase CoaBC [Saprospiraceae bacterium]|nr:bifunctional phosphopantothenoylcysteine decarboxylase/phosphopantothenate--cysteine ligase CoaBC [Saprospiraceae bacterium]MBP6446613.1 bifunctional phosphopantothenoylcysteine decarboxylase/phosphopantothenate--cysteine ligase CoaBC [Saprospiraceae bacterium]